jgi:hypothetical protein
MLPHIVYVEGDPDHLINRGMLYPNGASLEQEPSQRKGHEQALFDQRCRWP